MPLGAAPTHFLLQLQSVQPTNSTCVVFALENAVDPSRRSVPKHSHVRHRVGEKWSKQICLTERLVYKEIFFQAGEMGRTPPTLAVTCKGRLRRYFMGTSKLFGQYAGLRFQTTTSMWLSVLIKSDLDSLWEEGSNTVLYLWEKLLLRFCEILLYSWNSDQR